MVGEIGGGRDNAWEVVNKTGLDAALGIDDIPGKLEGMVTGHSNPADYFSVFRNWVLDESPGHRWYRNQVVTLVDDHDQVRKGGGKWRFCGDSRFRDLAFNVIAVQLTTMGIPCIYYGSEQSFDSGGRPNGLDLVLRENMFGGRFGGLCTQGRHFFNQDARPVPGPGRGSSTSARTRCRCARPAGVSSDIRRWRQLRPAAPPGGTDALARVLVAALY